MKLKLFENELIKILKRKNIYILLIIGIITILVYNIYCKISNNDENITMQYEQAYMQDTKKIEYYDKLTNKEDYNDLVERVKLEKYAIDNNIKYNILVNSENENIPIKTDARILLMRVFKNFEIIIIFIIIYISSTIFAEEYSTGTIKNLLVKPHKRKCILFSKVISSIFGSIIVAVLLITFQYFIGGIIFGFDSYGLDAIIYNHNTEKIEMMSLYRYMGIILACKIPMYISINLIASLIGVVTSNMSINVLLTLGMYLISKIGVTYENVRKFIFIYNWDLSNYIFGQATEIPYMEMLQQLAISFICIMIILLMLSVIFSKRDIKNE